MQFALESDSYGNDAHAVLAQVGAYLQEHPEVTVLQVLGYTDVRGSSRHNVDLDIRRTQHVRAALMRGGVAADRLQVRGVDAQDFRASNDTHASRMVNRRVGFVAVRGSVAQN